MLEEVVLGIGTPNFTQTLFSCLRRRAEVQRLLIYRFGPTRQVEVLAAEGMDEAVQRLTPQYHALDQTRRALPSTAEREMSVEVLAPEDIADDALRHWWALHHPGSPRISILVRRPEAVQVIDMFLAPQDGASVERLRDYIASNARAISSAAERHFELQKAPGPPSLADAVERLCAIPCHPPLSTREALVCAHIVSGYSNEAMALAIGISLHSVVTYRKRSYAKLRISSQQELFSLFFNASAPGAAPPSASALIAPRVAPLLSAPLAEPLADGEQASAGAIRQLQHSYCRVLHGLDLPFGSAVWHDDGLAIYDNYFEGTGREFWRWMATSYPDRTGLLHHLGETTIKVEGGYASSQTPVTLVRLRLSEEQIQVFTAQGRYIDDWSRHRGRWGLEKRRYVREAGFIQDLGPQGAARGPILSAGPVLCPPTVDVGQAPSKSEFLAGARSISGAKRRAGAG